MIDKLRSLYRFLSSRFQTVHLDYPVEARPRYGHGLPPHSGLYAVIDRERVGYAESLRGFLRFAPALQAIRPTDLEKNEDLPAWNNGFLPGLDIIALYGMIAAARPSNYIEIGSGNSTRVARKAINDIGLRTRVTSIDPFPRANIDHLADEVIRRPFESLDDNTFIVERLGPGDILFIDNSHRVLPNSDATICFLELLPRLAPGVIVHVHDIYLPYDYPQFMCDRYYSEQYMLAAFVLADPERYRTILPNWFISEDPELRAIIDPIWDHPNLKGVERHGGSYWLRIG